MAKAPALTPRKPSSVVLAAGAPTFDLPNGKTIEAGMILSIRGEAGRFKFKYARNGEITCWGGTKDHESWRTFRPERVRTASANARVELVANSVDATALAEMTPGQKAAHTKRLKKAAAVLVGVAA